MPDLLEVECEAMVRATNKLRAQLGALPSSSRVQQTSGPVTVPASAAFDAAIADAARKLVARLDYISGLLDEHADALRSAAQLLDDADADAVAAAAVLVDAVDSAAGAVAAAPTPAVGTTAAGVASKTGALK